MIQPTLMLYTRRPTFMVSISLGSYLERIRSGPLGDSGTMLTILLSSSARMHAKQPIIQPSMKRECEGVLWVYLLSPASELPWFSIFVDYFHLGLTEYPGHRHVLKLLVTAPRSCLAGNHSIQADLVDFTSATISYFLLLPFIILRSTPWY